MAISLKKHTRALRRRAIATGELTATTSATVSLYDISRHWRRLLRATGHRSEQIPGRSEREVEAAQIINHSLIYLQRIGSEDVEELLREVLRGRV